MIQRAIYTVTTLCLLFSAVAAAQVYRHVDEHGNVSYSDQPATAAEAQEHVAEAQRRAERKRRHLPVRKVSATERRRITADFEQAQIQLDQLEEDKLETCGKQPTGGFVGFGPDRDRHLAYDECEKAFKAIIANAERALKSARRTYLSME